MIFEQLVLSLKNRECPEFTVFKFFIIQNFEQPALALKTAFALQFFTVLKDFLSFRIFEQLELALKIEFALNFLSRGSGRPPPPRTPLDAINIVEKSQEIGSSLVQVPH